MTLAQLFDTSVLIAFEQGTALDDIDDIAWCTSAVTITELNVGVLRSRTAAEHQRRLRTFEAAVGHPVLDFDETTARTLAELLVWADDRGSRPQYADGVIAATAATHGLTLVTYDQGFEALGEFEELDLLIL